MPISIEYRPGKEAIDPDALSRLPVTSTEVENRAGSNDVSNNATANIVMVEPTYLARLSCTTQPKQP